MASSPDPLFRNGLEHYRKPAPATVWDRIESWLDRKRRKSIWLKVAAGLCLLIAASSVVWQLNDSDSAVIAVSKESAKNTSNVDSIASVEQEQAETSFRESSDVRREANSNREASVVNREADSNREASVVNREADSNRETSVVRRKKGVSREDVDSPPETQQISVVKADDLLETPASDIQIENSTEEWVKDVVEAQKSIIISYSSEEVNEKFLKKELIAEATPAKKSTSGLQKVIDKALEITNEGTVYGELREKKNEWLSLNILSNKTETNK